MLLKCITLLSTFFSRVSLLLRDAVGAVYLFITKPPGIKVSLERCSIQRRLNCFNWLFDWYVKSSIASANEIDLTELSSRKCFIYVLLVHVMPANAVCLY